MSSGQSTKQFQNMHLFAYHCRDEIKHSAVECGKFLNPHSISVILLVILLSMWIKFLDCAKTKQTYFVFRKKSNGTYQNFIDFFFGPYQRMVAEKLTIRIISNELKCMKSHTFE